MLQVQFPQGIGHGRPALGHAVHAGDEVEVLADGEVFPQGEALRHVADFALDRRGVADVVAEAGAVARIGPEQPADHADRGGLAAAVRAEEAVDLAVLHLQREILHHVLASEGLVQAVDVDGEGSFQLHVYRLPGTKVRSLEPRLDQKHELRARFLAEEHRRRVLGLVRDVAHLATTGPGQPSQRISMSLPTETALREVSGT